MVKFSVYLKRHVFIMRENSDQSVQLNKPYLPALNAMDICYLKEVLDLLLLLKKKKKEKKKSLILCFTKEVSDLLLFI